MSAFSKSKSVPREFVADFEAVAERYNLKALGEYDQAKAAARADLDSAIPCFAAMAREAA